MQKIIHFITHSRVWKSVFRHGWPDNPLDRSLVMTSNIFLHVHPVKVNVKSLDWRYSLGLGVISVIVFVELSLTGILLMFRYVPSVERAYSCINALQTQVPFGQLLRNMHRWGAHLMALIVLLPLLVFLPSKPNPREAMLVLFTILFVSAVVFTVIGFLCRGPDFILYPPWDMPNGYNPLRHL
ncbi:MAG: hypothetical protein A3K19_20850 [Lentisphaerae bacterium RIFOXYB12_FULL_65_16]|nr:MAG: hypothetical protein A3K18_19275 [Lentisphaerae bacterium RIFOXYA12_64_32]OGV85184.1 MAG: hypothetical protein A3K19_20850 [Lentisphaerae bacterium RIFOXYB12_FULL_65_16]